MPAAVFIWVWVCAYLNSAGWTLSALHQLNARGYAVVLLLGLAALGVWRKQSAPEFFPRIHWPKYRRRFRRGFPLAFLVLAALAFLGGALYAPTNYDALSYRLPRVLHWLADGQWHWIQSIFPRLNNRSCGIEWVSAPCLALLKTDRPLFLINFASFLLLPGLVFSVFTRLGVRRRVAWHWMWIVPTGYCFLLQAGSIGNDLFGAPFALAAVDFALRAKNSRAARDFFASALAAAMMTSAKPSNLPLLLPWAIALLPSLGLLRRWPLRAAAVGAVALLASYLPSAALNWKYCGDWSGLKLDMGVPTPAPLFLTGANAVLLPLQNFTPPVFPFSNHWLDFWEHGLPPGLHERLARTMEDGVRTFQLPQMQIEENAGLGFGVSLLLVFSVVAARFWKPAGKHRPVGNCLWQKAVRWTPFVSLLALMTQSRLEGIGREVTPYYPLLMPALLAAAGHEMLFRRRWWRALVLVLWLLAAGLVVVSPARPLFPVKIFLEHGRAMADSHPALMRMESVYSLYRQRNDAFAPVRAQLPPGVNVLGVIEFDDPITSLWRPIGSRQIEPVALNDTPLSLKTRGVEYILVRPDAFGKWFPGSFDDWCVKMNARVVWKIPLKLRGPDEPLDWCLLQLQ